jgi:predicted nucleic acid-binding OB-fold protein
MEQAKHTEFEPNSYVLVQYRTRAPPTRLRVFRRGPMQIAFGKDSRYLLEDIISQKVKVYHGSDSVPWL